jgi:predicted ATP-grasp superfamily ATP-dependent carboligase
MAFDRLRAGRAAAWAVDVNARPTTSIINIARVMEEEIGELILQAMFGGITGVGACDGRVHVHEGRVWLS